MTQFVDVESGELYEGPCPACAKVKDDAAIQVMVMEAERRTDRARVTKMQRTLESQATAKIDGKVWQRLLAAWLEAFPDKKPTATGPKSARATQVFLRLEQGATEQDFLDAIEGAKRYPYLTFGARTATATKESKRADDLQDIAAIKSDKLFDWLVEAGRAGRAPF